MEERKYKQNVEQFFSRFPFRLIFWLLSILFSLSNHQFQASISSLFKSKNPFVFLSPLCFLPTTINDTILSLFSPSHPFLILFPFTPIPFPVSLPHKERGRRREIGIISLLSNSFPTLNCKEGWCRWWERRDFLERGNQIVRKLKMIWRWRGKNEKWGTWCSSIVKEKKEFGSNFPFDSSSF